MLTTYLITVVVLALAPTTTQFTTHLINWISLAFATSNSFTSFSQYSSILSYYLHKFENMMVLPSILLVSKDTEGEKRTPLGLHHFRTCMDSI